jgi:hypothetical protein
MIPCFSGPAGVGTTLKLWAFFNCIQGVKDFCGKGGWFLGMTIENNGVVAFLRDLQSETRAQGEVIACTPPKWSLDAAPPAL